MSWLMAASGWMNLERVIKQPHLSDLPPEPPGRKQAYTAPLSSTPIQKPEPTSGSPIPTLQPSYVVYRQKADHVRTWEWAFEASQLRDTNTGDKPLPPNVMDTDTSLPQPSFIAKLVVARLPIVPHWRPLSYDPSSLSSSVGMDIDH